MGSTFHSLHYHVVFSTKDRRPLLRGDAPDRMHQYLGGTLRGLGGIPEAIGGVADHVHLLLRLRTTDAPADLVREAKKSSSNWGAQEIDTLFSWQEGYSIFTVSWTHVDAVRRYILGQPQHHRQKSFSEELRHLLEKNGVKYEPKYLE